MIRQHGFDEWVGTEEYREFDFGIICIEEIRGNYCLFETEFGDFGSWDQVWNDSWLDPLAELIEVGHMG